MSRREEKFSRLPIVEAPDLPRRFALWRYQWIGLPFLLLVPLLGFLGAFDAASARSLVSTGDLEITTQYPNRLRNGSHEEIRVTVENKSARPMHAIQIAFDTAFLDKMKEVAFVPAATDGNTVRIDRIGPGERRQISLRFRADWNGRNEGSLTVRPAGHGEAKAQLDSFAFP